MADERRRGRREIEDRAIPIILIAVVAFVIAFLVCFYFASPLYVFLVKPYVVASALQAVGGHNVSLAVRRLPDG